MSPESSRYLRPFPLRRLITFPHLPPPSLLPGGAVPAGPGGGAEDAGSPRVPCPRARVREKLRPRGRRRATASPGSATPASQHGLGGASSDAGRTGTTACPPVCLCLSSSVHVCSPPSRRHQHGHARVRLSIAHPSVIPPSARPSVGPSSATRPSLRACIHSVACRLPPRQSFVPPSALRELALDRGAPRARSCATASPPVHPTPPTRPSFGPSTPLCPCLSPPPPAGTRPVPWGGTLGALRGAGGRQASEAWGELPAGQGSSEPGWRGGSVLWGQRHQPRIVNHNRVHVFPCRGKSLFR